MTAINMGAQTENEVQAAVEHAFSSDFVFSSPKREADGKEVTDVLVLFGDVGLVIQAKSQALSTSVGPRADSLKWAKKNLEKAGRQTAGAIRALETGRMPYAENSRQDRVDFSTREFEWLYGLVVLNHESRPYNPFELVPQLKDAKVPLHVLSFSDFLNLANLLNTPADMICYLEDRSDALLSRLRPRVHEERAVFDYWVRHLERVFEFRANKNGWPVTKPDSERYASEMRRYLSGEMKQATAGVLVDHLIDRCHDLDPTLTFNRDTDDGMQAPSGYARIATELGFIPRVRRIALGKRFLRVTRIAGVKQVDRWTASHSKKRSDCLLFLASPLPRSERDERRERLSALTQLLKHHHQARKAIGIATEAGTEAGRSYDFVLSEGEPMENEELSQLGRETFKEGGLLTDEPGET